MEINHSKNLLMAIVYVILNGMVYPNRMAYIFLATAVQLVMFICTTSEPVQKKHPITSVLVRCLGLLFLIWYDDNKKAFIIIFVLGILFDYCEPERQISCIIE